jgi:hypothetical protein
VIKIIEIVLSIIYTERGGDTEREKRFEEKRAAGFFFLEGGGFGYFFRYLHNSLGA